MISKELSPLAGCIILKPAVFTDFRGYFLESYQQIRYDDLLDEKIHFIQDNDSFSKRGVIRGLHYQTGECSQSKLVRVLRGQIWDVAVDLREESPTYLRSFGILLSEENHKQLFIPRGFAHGFSVLSDFAVISYKCDNYYRPEAESGIRYDDPYLNIDWQLPKNEHILSEKDLNLPFIEIKRT